MLKTPATPNLAWRAEISELVVGEEAPRPSAQSWSNR
jgi:hypothetical protein